MATTSSPVNRFSTRRAWVSVSAAWALGAPFWRSSERWSAILLLGTIVALTLGLVAIAVLLTYWQRAFFNALEARDWSSFIALLTTWDRGTETGFMPGFGPILVIYVFFTVYALYLQQALHIRWRGWMTAQYLRRWFTGRAYYRMALRDQGSDNPDQRIAEDVDLFVDQTLTLGLGLLSALVSFVSFIVLLWTLSADVWIFGAPVPGSLVWLALSYAAAGTLVTDWLGRSLIGLNFLKQRAEADFRFGLVRARENAESIAFYGGETNEVDGLEARFSLIVANWRRIMTVTKRMTFFASGYTQAALVFPLAIVAPAYFAGRIPLGGIFQSASAFVKVQESLSWFVSNYSSVAKWSATVSRLEGFVTATTEPDPKTELVRERGGDRLIVSEVNIWTPDGRSLLHDARLVVGPGERVLLKGPSGVGKSTFLRALAGLWPEMSGRIVLPEGTRMFLPQKPYLPTGPLRRAVIYPMRAERVNETNIVRCLREAGLPHLAAHLDRDDVWSSKLSGGESQRLALARVLILRPDWLFLDEATANLDLAGEASFYRIIESHLPNATIISVAHRPQVELFHERIIEFFGNKIRDNCARYSDDYSDWMGSSCNI